MWISCIFLFPLLFIPWTYGQDCDTGDSVDSRTENPLVETLITLTLEDEWYINDAETTMGLDVWTNGGEIRIIFCDQVLRELGSFDPVTGVVVGAIPLDPSNTECFGVAFNNNLSSPLWYTNDCSETCLYYTTDLTTWGTTPNPSGALGRGMDFDGNDYWQTFGDSGVYRFQPGVVEEFVELPGVSGVMSGLTVFPFNGNLGIVVTCYESHKFHFHEWDGSTITYLGSADCPSSVYNSDNFGLAYCDLNGMLYWSYINTTFDTVIAEISFEIIVGLQQDTWGSIKSGF